MFEHLTWSAETYHFSARILFSYSLNLEGISNTSESVLHLEVRQIPRHREVRQINILCCVSYFELTTRCLKMWWDTVSLVFVFDILLIILIGKKWTGYLLQVPIWDLWWPNKSLFYTCCTSSNHSRLSWVEWSYTVDSALPLLLSPCPRKKNAANCQKISDDNHRCWSVYVSAVAKKFLSR